MTYDEMKADTKWSDEQLGRYLFSLLQLQEAKLKQHEPKAANQASYKRRENRG